MDDEISTTGDFRPAAAGGKNKNISVITGLTSTIKVEAGTVVRPPPVMEGSAKTSSSGKTKDGEWCAVCHDGGDTLYCCDRCPNVYHMFCYIPPLTQEPPDDWICLMYATTNEILSVSPGIDLFYCYYIKYVSFSFQPKSRRVMESCRREIFN